MMSHMIYYEHLFLGFNPFAMLRTIERTRAVHANSTSNTD